MTEHSIELIKALASQGATIEERDCKINDHNMPGWNIWFPGVIEETKHAALCQFISERGAPVGIALYGAAIDFQNNRTLFTIYRFDPLLMTGK